VNEKSKEIQRNRVVMRTGQEKDFGDYIDLNFVKGKESM
jgi:hypothetical protein